MDKKLRLLDKAMYMAEDLLTKAPYDPSKDAFNPSLRTPGRSYKRDPQYKPQGFQLDPRYQEHMFAQDTSLPEDRVYLEEGDTSPYGPNGEIVMEGPKEGRYYVPKPKQASPEIAALTDLFSPYEMPDIFWNTRVVSDAIPKWIVKEEQEKAAAEGREYKESDAENRFKQMLFKMNADAFQACPIPPDFFTKVKQINALGGNAVAGKELRAQKKANDFIAEYKSKHGGQTPPQEEIEKVKEQARKSYRAGAGVEGDDPRQGMYYTSDRDLLNEIHKMYGWSDEGPIDPNNPDSPKPEFTCCWMCGTRTSVYNTWLSPTGSVGAMDVKTNALYNLDFNPNRLELAELDKGFTGIQGGKYNPPNLHTACRQCNVERSDTSVYEDTGDFSFDRFTALIEKRWQERLSKGLKRFTESGGEDDPMNFKFITDPTDMEQYVKASAALELKLDSTRLNKFNNALKAKYKQDHPDEKVRFKRDTDDSEIDPRLLPYVDQLSQEWESSNRILPIKYDKSKVKTAKPSAPATTSPAAKKTETAPAKTAPKSPSPAPASAPPAKLSTSNLSFRNFLGR